MSDLASSRTIIQTEAVSFGAAASESTITAIAASTNFNSEFQGRDPQWKLNGPYQSKTAGFVVDGSWIAPHDCKIYYFSMSNLSAGSSGTTEVDILRHTASGSGTTIFSTRPAITSAAGNNAFMAKRYADTVVTDENPTGTTLPVFVSLDLNRGDMLTCQIVSVQTGGSNFTLTLNVRPR